MAVDVDTTKGLFYGQGAESKFNRWLHSTDFLVYFELKNRRMRIKSIRHVMKPSATFSYVPYLDV